MSDSIDQKPAGPAKSFMTAGPTLHYSHSNVRNCWLLAVAVFIAACIFWSKVLTGAIVPTDLLSLIDPASLSLSQYILKPLSIYEYPWQMAVLGILMGIFAVAPIIVSQLLSFRYSVPMILALIFIANLQIFGLVVLFSCIAVACRPLRFRSRFISVSLCLAPQFLYWAFFGGVESVDPIRWGFAFAPWIIAGLTGIAIAGTVIGIGHFTRYKPGLVWAATAAALAIAIITFQYRNSFAELDYQLYIVNNNPEEVAEFHDYNLKNDIDGIIAARDTDPQLARTLNVFFYPTDPVKLRAELKGFIKEGLERGFKKQHDFLPQQLNFQEKRRSLIRDYDRFIDKHSNSKRLPIAIYYKAMLHEYRPDIRQFDQQEVLHFYNGYPDQDTLSDYWQNLYVNFPQTPEALEARSRIAMLWAGQGQFNKTLELCQVTKAMLAEKLQQMQNEKPADKTFSKPAETVMTPRKLNKLNLKISQLQTLISENLTDDDASRQRLAKFITLNPYRREYPAKIEELIAQTTTTDPLHDNLMLAKAELITDIKTRAEKLRDIAILYAQTDGGMRALYELGNLNVKLWKSPQTDKSIKPAYLADARSILEEFISVYPESIFTNQAKAMLQSLPATK